MTFDWLKEENRLFLSRGYTDKPEERYREIADAAERILGIEGFGNKLYEYFSNGWVALSTPIITNFGNNRGLPISCFGAYINDSVESILDVAAEIGIETKMGGGTSAYFGSIRPMGTPISTGGFADGPKHYMELIQSVTNLISQGTARRGHTAAWFNIDHPDINTLLNSREEGDPIQDLSIGVTISDEWMKSMLAGDKNKQALWLEIIRKRFESGFPYIMFSDTVNRNKPVWYEDYTIWASNMCTEIALPSSLDESFVCCLSALNVSKWDEWKNTNLVYDMTLFLDASISEFIEKTEGMKFMERARTFAINHRAIGLGVLGWHTLLQSKMLPFGSDEARKLNIEIWVHMKSKSELASRDMAKKYGPCFVAEKYGRRNTTTLTQAPTTSSSFILGAGQISPAIEPWNSNYFTEDLAKGKFIVKNKYLKELLQLYYDADTEEVWQSILEHGGSVQHFEWMEQEDKDVFKTFGEINQADILIQASDRQKYIDQSQSLNLTIPADASPKQVSDLMITAWKMNIKTLYYQRSTSPAQEMLRDLLSCAACEV